MVPVVQLVGASDCGSECRGFESHRAPNKIKSLQVITCRDFYFSKDYFVVNNHSGILSYIDFHQESSSLSHLANHAKMVFCHFMRFS